jgi:hypothetical protein
LLSPVKMSQCSKLPCLGWRSADILQGFFRPKCLQEHLKHVRSSTKIPTALHTTGQVAIFPLESKLDFNNEPAA